MKRIETLELVRDKTDVVIRGINAKARPSDKDPDWAKLHALLAGDSLDENERGMFEHYAKYLFKNKRLTTKQHDWLAKRTSPAFDVKRHQAQMERWKSSKEVVADKRQGRDTLCLSCARWLPSEHAIDCAHEEVAKLSASDIDTSVVTGFASAAVKHAECHTLSIEALRNFVDKLVDEGTAEVIEIKCDFA